MNARTNTQQQQQQQQTTSEYTDRLSPADLEAEIQRRLKKAEKIKHKLDAIQEIRATFDTAERAKTQTTNLRKQVLQTQPKLRGSTTTHVGSPRLGPYTRKPRDSVNIRDPKQYSPKNNRPLTTTFVQSRNTSGRVHPSVGKAPKRPLQRSDIRGDSPAIADRTASGFRVGKSGAPIDIQSRLKKKSPWFSSIMDPLANGGVKIPDPVGTDTGTYQHVENISVGVNVNGIAGLRVCTPYINSYEAGDVGGNGANYQTTTQTGTSGGPSSLSHLNWGATSATKLMYAFARIPEMLKSVAQSHRVVSAWIVAQPEISTLSDAGEMCAFVKPFDCVPFDVAYSELQSQWDSSIMPVNQHKPLVARWYPLSSDYFPFNGQRTVKEDGVEPPAISYQDFIDPDIHGEVTDTSGVLPWEFGVVCTGMTPNTGVVRFQVVINYEYIPKTATGAISGATPDKCDVTESNLVSGWVSDCAVTGVVPQSVISRPPAACSVPEEPSGFGMMFNVIEEMMPLITKGAAMLL